MNFTKHEAQKYERACTKVSLGIQNCKEQCIRKYYSQITPVNGGWTLHYQRKISLIQCGTEPIDTFQNAILSCDASLGARVCMLKKR